MKKIVVRILDLQPVEREGNVKAFLSVQIGPARFHELRLIQQPGQAAWVSPPQRSWEDAATGQRKYRALVEFPKEWRIPLNEAAAAAWQEYQRTGGRPQ